MTENESKKFSGMTEEDAVARACAEMGLMRSELEYKVIDKGGRALLGLVKKEVVISAYRKPGIQKKTEVKEVLSKNEYGFSIDDSTPKFGNGKKTDAGNRKTENKERQHVERKAGGGASSNVGRRHNSNQSRGRNEEGRARNEEGRGRSEENRGRSEEGRGRSSQRPRPQDRRDSRRTGQSSRYRNDRPRERKRVQLLPPEEEKALFEEKRDIGVGFLNNIFKHYECSVEIEASTDNGKIIFSIHSEDIGNILSKSDHFIPDVQHLLDKVVNKDKSRPTRRVSLNYEKPLSERDVKLKSKSEALAEKVIKLGKPIALGPMSSADRRIVHLSVRGISGVVTESKGMSPNRRVAILPVKKPVRRPVEKPQETETPKTPEAAEDIEK